VLLTGQQSYEFELDLRRPSRTSSEFIARGFVWKKLSLFRQLLRVLHSSRTTWVRWLQFA